MSLFHIDRELQGVDFLIIRVALANSRVEFVNNRVKRNNSFKLLFIRQKPCRSLLKRSPPAFSIDDKIKISLKTAAIANSGAFI